MKLKEQYSYSEYIKGYEVRESEVKEEILNELHQKGRVELKTKGSFGDVMAMLGKSKEGTIVLQRYKKYPLKRIKAIVCKERITV